ncbi:helix-turn-helix domain-containing protein [Streptomyces chilikensis]|uniref:Helix-turn-helix domain-containing protein n=1 Tax=Streptomyces chilikensis TaxID=1194079 RepID=A0ABV3ERK8_9ACTN
MPAAHQWIHATDGRIAPDAFSWMQAVHWVAGSGLYTPSSSHGPRAWNETTTAIACEVSALTECRPGVDYLARKLRISERTVKYHLAMLREAGLLVYRSKGTRLRGGGSQASVFERIIPVAFDIALGIRTAGEGVQRRIVGADQEHRKTLGALAKKAARKVTRRRRRTPSRTPVSGRSRCTPMEGSSTGGSAAGSSHLPSESKLASGQGESTTGKSSNSTGRRGRKTRKHNHVGRRYQLAAELIAQVPWLARANRDRIAWIIREFADAGWTAREVQAAAEYQALPDRGVLRPSGFLARRLEGLAGQPAAQRAAMVALWEESRTAANIRHQEQKTQQQGPTSQWVRNLLAEASRRVRDIATGPSANDKALYVLDSSTADVDVTDLDPELVAQARAEAERNPQLVADALAAGIPADTLCDLYGTWAVHQATQILRTLTPAY